MGVELDPSEIDWRPKGSLREADRLEHIRLNVVNGYYMLRFVDHDPIILNSENFEKVYKQMDQILNGPVRWWQFWRKRCC